MYAWYIAYTFLLALLCRKVNQKTLCHVQYYVGRLTKTHYVMSNIMGQTT
jgi:uncharacterized membrane protein YeiB